MSDEILMMIACGIAGLGTGYIVGVLRTAVHYERILKRLLGPIFESRR